MFNLISLGLNANSITAEALQAIKKSKTIYLESYTVNFPYTIKELEKSLNKLVSGFTKSFGNTDKKRVGSRDSELSGQSVKPETQTAIKITPLQREKVESEEILQQAKKQNISLLVYGDALSATTHSQLILSCKKQKIPYKVLHNSSILTAISESGLSLYKFGKTASMPSWKEHTNKPTSFIQYIKQNQSIKAHTLLLIDIDLELKDAKQQLKESAKKENLKLNKIILLSNAGTKKQKISYNTLDKLPNSIKPPYCIIIPSDLQMSEEEFLDKI